ncbi:hypothetical protein BKA69DRAFT_838854 [Paraphysoderma sedebokerense]|nr:hypothetical protein BKA69DRAFT_838854 [Paraphysoderma sedebokerense]
MPITVHAHIAQDAVFYAGEKFSCTVTIKNEVGPQSDISTSVPATPSDSSFAIPLLNQFSELNLGSTNASSTDLLSNSAPTSPQKSQGYFVSKPPTSSTNSLQNSSTALPQHEAFLWGYIQLIGNFNVDNGLLNQNVLNGFLGKLKTMAAATTGGVNVKHGITGRDDSYPTFTTPSSLLFVDLKLAPGESKTCRYSNNLRISFSIFRFRSSIVI